MTQVIFILLSVFSLNVLANDSASPVISVKGIDPMGTPSGTSFKIYGGNTSSLFEMIPAISSVMPELDKEEALKYRTLDVASNGWNLNITCRKVDENGNALPQGSECLFKLSKNNLDTGLDYYEWAPACSAAE